MTHILLVAAPRTHVSARPPSRIAYRCLTRVRCVTAVGGDARRDGRAGVLHWAGFEALQMADAQVRARHPPPCSDGDLGYAIDQIVSAVAAPGAWHSDALVIRAVLGRRQLPPCGLLAVRAPEGGPGGHARRVLQHRTEAGQVGEGGRQRRIARAALRCLAAP